MDVDAANTPAVGSHVRPPRQLHGLTAIPQNRARMENDAAESI
jgi:hypothetical protein